MVDAEMNEVNENNDKPFSSGEDDENALLADDEHDNDTTGAHAIPPINYGKLFKDCKRKLIFWQERQHASPMLHSSGN